MTMNDELLKMSVAKNLKVHSVLHQMQRYDTSFVLQLINNPILIGSNDRVRARNDERNIPDIHAGEVSMSFGNSDLFYSTRTVSGSTRREFDEQSD